MKGNEHLDSVWQFDSPFLQLYLRFSFDKISQTLEAVFDLISTQPEVHQKYST